MTRRSRAALALGFGGIFALWAHAPSNAAPQEPDAFAACRRQFVEKPQDYDSAYCFYQTALQQRRWDEGARAFEMLLRDHPRNWWVPLAYGHMHRERDPDRAEALYRRAADGFRKDANAGGEIVARSNLRNFLFLKGRLPDAAAELDRVAALEPVVADPQLKAQIWTLQALHVQDTAGDLGVAYRLLKRAERATAQAPYRVKRNTLSSLALVAFRLGHVDEALGLYATLEQMAAGERDPRQLASARYNLLNVSSLKETLLPTPDSRRRLMALAERSLESGLSGDHAAVTMKAHRAIAALLAGDPASHAKALIHVRECLALSVAARQPHDEAVCSWLEARLLQVSDPGRAREAIARALAATARTGSPLTQAYGAGRQMRLSWGTKPRPEAIRDSMSAIDAVETLRSLQEDADSSAELFSIWTLDYYWLSGHLLRDRRDDEVDLAFSITERLRARSLLDQVSGLDHRLDASHPAVRQRRSILEQIAAVQRRLMDPATGDGDRRAALEELDQLEVREQDARHQIALAANRARTPVPAFASLGAVQAALSDREALLSFQVGIWETYEGEFGGGAWLIVVTRRGRAVYRLPDRGALAPMVPVFNGLLARDDRMGVAAAVRLYEDLLGPALRDLPPEIDRLVLIPDGPLHRLPFDALQAARDRAPVGARYELATAPSATLWLQWRRHQPTPARGGALAFADPEFEAAESGAAAERNLTLQHGMRFGRLPYAVRESRAMKQHVAPVDALVGARASEKALKQRNLRDYGVLHFAAHAVADESRPERSAVLLAPGDAGEDGLLQAREIEELGLDGRIVVLSACRTASGAVLNGEGVMSLARAFFAAGARSVVGTRWPVRDADAAALFDSFYRALGAGATLSEALRQARRDAIDAGRPAAAWASVVLLGDGTIRPFHDRPRSSATNTALLVGGSLAAAVLLLFAVRRITPLSS